MLGFVLIALPIVIYGAYPVGAVLLLCRLRLGRRVILTASAAMVVLIALLVFRVGGFGRHLGAFALLGTLVAGVAGLTASKSTRKWLDRNRA